MITSWSFKPRNFEISSYIISSWTQSVYFKDLGGGSELLSEDEVTNQIRRGD